MNCTRKINPANFSDYSDSRASYLPIQNILGVQQTIFAVVSAFATSAHYS